jgi:hypothetical protein
MKKITLSTVAVLSLVSALNANDSVSLFNNIKANGEVRFRYENVDVQDQIIKDANAMTVRATIGIAADVAGVDGLSMKADATTVQAIGGQSYNSTSNGQTGYQTVVDPVQTRFTQGYLQYKNSATTVKGGRQLINLDNQRFIGAVDWRQMPQSFDSAVIVNNSIENLTLIGGYVWGINGIKDLPTTNTNSVVLHAAYKVNPIITVTGYDYMLSSLHDTAGLALTGDIPLANAKIGYRAEYASQGDASLNTSRGVKNAQADAHYYNLDALANINGVLVGGGYEVLSGSTGSDGKTAFQTPLATLHAFNGWADKFLVTPIGGLCDTSATLGYTNPTLGKAMVVYHNFKTDHAMATKSDLGHEWDMLYTNAIPGVKGLSGLIKAGYYKAGDVATFTKDVSKVWLQLDYKF